MRNLVRSYSFPYYMIKMIKPICKLSHDVNVRNIVLKTEKYKNLNIGTYVL